MGVITIAPLAEPEEPAEVTVGAGGEARRLIEALAMLLAAYRFVAVTVTLVGALTVAGAV